MISDKIYDFISELPPELLLRAHENRALSLLMENGKFHLPEREHSCGVHATARAGDRLLMASRPGYDADGIRTVIREVGKNRVSASALKLPQLGCCMTSMDSYDASEAEIRDYLEAVDAHIIANCPKVQDRGLCWNQFSTEKRLAAAWGSRSHSLFSRGVLNITLSAEAQDGDYVSIEECLQMTGDYAPLLHDPKGAFSAIDRAYDALMQKCEGVQAKAGMFTCILGADPACIMVHEAIGHTFEADLVMGGSIGGRYLGKQIGSSLVNIGDFASSMRGMPVPQPIEMDDEGCIARDAILVDKGVLTGFMHDRDSAAHYGIPSTGNARAYSYADIPLIRMRNTALLPGTSKLEEMIASVDEGYYLVRAGMGQADTTGEYMFLIVEGYEICGGRLGRAIRDSVCSGRAFETLQSIDMVGDTLIWDAAGMCGKGQPMPTAAGAPAIRCRIRIGG